ncbi:UvrD-helicase domain-containing protein [Pseudoalteromonas sp. MQS005]|uniref:UvrD-helicase domain-containing protein n=1 Tax=Pseudoalteromonas sp. MQS005 TaxID=1854052 RepID=UPI0007E51E41|nr:ATP-dependent helicase [Pseudoalteromonas sp. MQS005]
MGLTPDQDLAANDIDNHSLILATAGSGKTKVLIDKVRNVLRNNYHSTVLMVTFTNAAVNEMKERLEIALSSSEIARVSVTTFHKAFLDQSRNLLKGKLLIGPTYYNFIDRLRAYLDKEALIPDVKLTNSDVGNILSGQEPKKDYTDDDIKLVKETYRELKEKNNFYDLDDAAKRAVDGIANNEIPLMNYTHMLIDEFQDTDLVQYDWISLHGHEGVKLTPVGDDDQSIYSWRGARSYETMLKFKKEFSPNIHMLTKCFRCRPEIISAAKNMIEFNADRIPKEMVSGKGDGGSVTTYIHKYKKSQYSTFLENYNKYGGEWAVITRTNKMLESAEEFMKSNDIPYTRSNDESIFKTTAGDFIIKLSAVLLNKNEYSYLAEVLGYLREDENVTHIITNAIKDDGNIEASLNNEGFDVTGTVFEFFYRNNKLFENCYNDNEIAGYIELLTDLILSKRRLGNPNVTCAAELTLLEGLKTRPGSWFDKLSQYADKLKDLDTKKEIDKSVVSLITYHGSKGLEWQNVAIFDAVEEIMPYALSEVNEERRLMLVGMTRAEERLFIHSYLDVYDIDDLDDVGKPALFDPSKEYEPQDFKDGFYPSSFIYEIYFKEE